MSQAEWRPWKPARITPELVEEAARLFSSGATSYKIVAGALGVRPGKFLAWIREGEKEIEQIEEAGKGYPGEEGHLYQAVLEAVCKGRIDLTNRIVDGDKNSKSLTWILERLEREDYGPREQVERGPVTIVVQSAFPGIAPAEVIEVAAADVRELPQGE